MNRPSDAYAELIHHIPWLSGDVTWRVIRMKKIVLSVEQRAVPYFGDVAMKCIRAGLGDEVDLSNGIPALVHGEGIGIDGRFLHGVESDDQIGCRDRYSNPAKGRSSRNHRECSRWKSQEGR